MNKYSVEDVIDLYKEVKRTKGKEAYKHVSEVFEKAKIAHKEDFLKRKPNGNHEQSWHRFIGNCFEKLLQFILQGLIEEFGLEIVNGNKLDKSKLPQKLDTVKRNVLINFGEFGMQLPDADIIIFNPENCRVFAIISSKTSLAERVAQTSYWKFKLLESQNTEHIRVYLITTDRLNDLTKRYPAKKSRIIAEVELDCTYVLTQENVEESDKVKLFEHFINDFKKVIEETQ